MREPRFWRRGGNPWPARLLSPAGALYGAVTILRRWSHRPYRAPVRVVVAGGVTLGGAGKTPLALALAELLAAQRPHFLSRGYGGSEAGPLRVDPSRHGAKDVGDEPLLLAAKAPTWVARDRAAGAKAAAAAGAGLIILDDGFQNPFLAKDLAFLAIDGESGLGNGHVFPAGPLREPFATALRRAQAVVLIGEDRAGISGSRRRPLPDPAGASGRRRSCRRRRQARLCLRRDRPAGEILRQPRRRGRGHRRPPGISRSSPLQRERARRGAGRGGGGSKAMPITTAKDRLRLPAAVRDQVQVFEVKLAFDDPAAVEAMLGRL